MDKQTESREQFEAEFRLRHSFVPEASMALMLEQYNFGTEDEPDWGYYSLAARDAWEWWKKSRESLVVELPRPTCTYADHSYPAYSQKQVEKMLVDCGIRIKGEGV